MDFVNFDCSKYRLWYSSVVKRILNTVLEGNYEEIKINSGHCLPKMQITLKIDLYLVFTHQDIFQNITYIEIP